MPQPLKFYEFFAGGGMARAALAHDWQCLFANDFDQKKCRTYRENWGGDHLLPGDIGAVSTSDLPAKADLAWASSPCQDFSLAGKGAGLAGNKSNVFWSFWRLITDLSEENRKPRSIVIENVKGLINSRGGKDFETICRALSVENYEIGAFVIDAKHFLPQSRPRIFIVGLLREETQLPKSVSPIDIWHPKALQAAVARFEPFLAENWNWWHLPEPPKRNTNLASILEDGARWHSSDMTEKLLEMMSDTNRQKVDDRVGAKDISVGAAFRRTRIENGLRKQRIEIRFDNIAGCLRTPGGGSSRQTIFEVGSGRIKSRLLTARETARLMGLNDEFKLPVNLNEALQLSGDGVAVPVVEFLAQNVLKPALIGNSTEAADQCQKNPNSAKVLVSEQKRCPS